MPPSPAPTPRWTTCSPRRSARLRAPAEATRHPGSGRCSSGAGGTRRPAGSSPLRRQAAHSASSLARGRWKSGPVRSACSSASSHCSTSPCALPDSIRMPHPPRRSSRESRRGISHWRAPLAVEWRQESAARPALPVSPGRSSGPSLRRGSLPHRRADAAPGARRARASRWLRRSGRTATRSPRESQHRCDPRPRCRRRTR
jgi:hypothetical protein